MEFAPLFKHLSGNAPFPWQAELFHRLCAGSIPSACSLPTGLGKTAIIPIWLIALASAPTKIPRRLVYVVNRRTVVDQATREAVNLRKNLPQVPELTQRLAELCTATRDIPLAISTLRGQFADIGEWCGDPSRPAIIVGTVDMIGSRLLFSGYGCGFKRRPLHAGFLGQDVLLVHDEAHLEPAFQELLNTIQKTQEEGGEFRRFHVMELSATSRGDAQGFTLSAADNNHPTVAKRIGATKHLRLHPLAEEKKLAEELAKLALAHAADNTAVLVFARSVETVGQIAQTLRKQEGQDHVETLTGTLRGLERDRLTTYSPVFARFLPEKDRSNAVTPKSGTVYLVCTSAGEVGIDISADHLVCDLAPFDSMAQRLGRVNRYGDRDDTLVDVIYPQEFADDKELDVRRSRTLLLLQALNGDASPSALGKLNPAARLAAFTPTPTILPSTDILFDTWALTTIREKLPGRPPVAAYLHGVADWEPPETRVAWRNEVGILTGDLLEQHQPEDLLEDYPLKPHELLRDRTDRVFKELQKIAERTPQLPIWMVEADGRIAVATLEKVRDSDKEQLVDVTLLLPPAAGGLNKGLFDGGAEPNATQAYDVADEWLDEQDKPRRVRVWDDDTAPAAMRLIRTLDTNPEANREESDEPSPAARRYWRWFVRPRSADDDGSQTGPQEQELTAHLQNAEAHAQRIVAPLQLADIVARAVILAARYHDRGKDRPVWQRSIGNRDYPARVLAKSNGQMNAADLSSYRHEFGSLLDMTHDSELAAEPDEVKELVRHLVAAHHGRGRPHFPECEAFDPSYPLAAAEVLAREVPRRFAHLQRKYGRWGLAYIESLLRAADILASQGSLPQPASALLTEAAP